MHSPWLLCLGTLCFIVGLFGLGVSVVMGQFAQYLKEGFSYKSGGRASDFDACSPIRQLDIGYDAVEYRQTWWIEICPEVSSPDHKFFEPQYFDAICSCTKARLATIVLMGFTGFSQFVVGIVFSCLGSGPCQLSLRRAWVIFCGFLVFFFILCLISFVLALVFKMDRQENKILYGKKATETKNSIGTAFTAICGIDMFFCLIGISISIVGIVKGDKNNQQAAPVRSQVVSSGQGQNQGQGQRSQTPPPAYSKSQTNSQTNASAKSKSSSQITNKR